TDLSKLGDYLSSEGRYTPFVSHVFVEVDNPMLKDLIVVDTPGLNDPNELRSTLTTNFINRSSAVVYLFFSTSPLGSPDVEFIDRHLSSVSPSKIVFGMSRCDLVKDVRTILEYIEDNLRTIPELRERNLLRDSKVYPVSTLAARIGQKQRAGETLTPEEQFFVRKIPRTLIDDGGLMEPFLAAIEKHIMEDKAASILDSAYQRIREVCSARIDGISGELGQLEMKVRDLQLSKEELRHKIGKTKEARLSTTDAIDEFAKRKDRVTLDISDRLSAGKESVLLGARATYSTWLAGQKVDAALKLTSFQINSILVEQITRNINKSLADHAFRELEAFQSEIKQSLRDKVQAIFPVKRWEFLFTPIISIRQIIDEVLRETRDWSASLEELRVMTWGLFTNKRASKINLEEGVYRFIDHTVTLFFDNLRTRINVQLLGFFEKLATDILQLLNDYENQLQGLDAEELDKTDNLETARARMELLSGHLERFGRSYASFESSIAAKWRIYNAQKPGL
ncbi:MAG TPA: hypothetical protein VKQ52_02785, partial [Puia sp.]|nr:hypothetical protein [Puia sp.]